MATTLSELQRHLRDSTVPWVTYLMLIVSLWTVPVSSVRAEALALVGGTLFVAPYDDAIEEGVVVLSNGKIVSVGSVDDVEMPAGATTMDVSGLYVTAGFWNSHVHYAGTLEAAAMESTERLNKVLSDNFLSWGFVNTVDTGSWLQNTLRIRERISSEGVNGPRIIIAGGGFVPVGGSPFYIKPIELPELRGPESTRESVLSTLKAGADAIKLFTGSWANPQTVIVMQPEDVRAATDAAHEQGALVFAHPSDSYGARVAIENGVDILAHVFPSQMKGPWDQSLPGEIASRNMAVVPTLKLWRLELVRAGLPENMVAMVENTAVAQTRAIHEAGATILFGTDVGYIKDADTSEEFRLMAEAGMDHEEILTSLTTAPAERYGLAETDGRVQAGYRADLVVLGSDPRNDVTAYADVVATIRSGKIVYRR